VGSLGSFSESGLGVKLTNHPCCILTTILGVAEERRVKHQSKQFIFTSGGFGHVSWIEYFHHRAVIQDKWQE
jgi:hypothetical protein